MGGIAGLQATNDFDQAHHRHRVEEVQADETFRLADTGSELGDRQRRGVGGDHALGADLCGNLLQHPQFQFEVFGGGFDHQLRVVQAAVIGAGADLVEGGVLLLGAQGFLGDLAVKVLADGGEGFLQGTLADVQQGHVETGQGADLRNAVAHGAGADHANVLQIHVAVLSINPAIPWPP